MTRQLSLTQSVKLADGVMIRRCAWCSRIIGAVTAPGQTGETHGLCRKCYYRMLAGIQAGTKEKGDA